MLSKDTGLMFTQSLMSSLVSLSSDAPAPDVTNRHMSPLSSVDCDLKFCFSRPSYFPFVERLRSDDIIKILQHEQSALLTGLIRGSNN